MITVVMLVTLMKNLDKTRQINMEITNVPENTGVIDNVGKKNFRCDTLWRPYW